MKIIYVDQSYLCVEPEKHSDGECNDENNNDDCYYDGGDCCEETVNGNGTEGVVIKTQCSRCICIDPSVLETR